MTLSNDRPAYRILAIHGFFGPDDHLYELGEEIWFDDEPNEEMEPLNEMARAKLSAFLEKLDAKARTAAEKLNRPFIERPRTLDGQLALATQLERDQQAIMNAPKEVRSVGRVEQDSTPEVGGSNPKRGRGRPVGTGKKLSISSQAHAA